MSETGLHRGQCKTVCNFLHSLYIVQIVSVLHPFLKCKQFWLQPAKITPDLTSLLTIKSARRQESHDTVHSYVLCEGFCVKHVCGLGEIQSTCFVPSFSDKQQSISLKCQENMTCQKSFLHSWLPQLGSSWWHMQTRTNRNSLTEKHCKQVL